ncbi:MAG: L,D-transpeptidase [Anaerolineae bacterium]|nr:L,D-transpeptidase [Anaerolineae bacterium]MCO5207065.1 L,D-transpeptidase [Anaerolineae bacterium]
MKRIFLVAVIASLIGLSLLWVDSAEAICYRLRGDDLNSCEISSTLEPAGPVFAEPELREDNILTRMWVGRIADFANVYSQPSAASPVVRNVGDGFLYATIRRSMESEGERWYEINIGEYVRAAEVAIVSISDFHGVVLDRQPQRPFGWFIVDFRPSSVPGGEPDYQFEKIKRYYFFEVYDAVEADDGWLWYDIGNGMWINQQYVSLVDVNKRPDDIGPNDKWVEVDLYEQSLAAYEGDRMVFATLISSGLNRWPTYEGLFRVRYRHDYTNMSGAEGLIDYYLVEDVPNTMFFDIDNEIALHGAYWHDRFGYKHSHGCVNMPPLDAEWVYDWSADTVVNPDGYDENGGLWVWVHESDPLHYFDKFAVSNADG